MKARLSDLWDPRGTVDRGTYAFWRVFSDEIIHRIHLRVLEHIRKRSESEGGRRP